MSGYRPDVPYGVTATGVQRALGERRKRRMAERGGHVDFDETMSSWPVPDPPTRARPVVRPRRAMPGAATRPVLPTPATLILDDLASHAPQPSAVDNGPDSRRSRRTGETGLIAVTGADDTAARRRDGSPDTGRGRPSAPRADAAFGAAATGAAFAGAATGAAARVRPPASFGAAASPPAGAASRAAATAESSRQLGTDVASEVAAFRRGSQPGAATDADPFAAAARRQPQPGPQVTRPGSERPGSERPGSERPGSERPGRGSSTPFGRVPPPERPGAAGRPGVDRSTAVAAPAEPSYRAAPAAPEQPLFDPAARRRVATGRRTVAEPPPFDPPARRSAARRSAAEATRAPAGPPAAPWNPGALDVSGARRRPLWRRRGVLAVVAVLAVLVAVAVAVLAVRAGGSGTAALRPANDAPRQDTALAAVLADDGTIAQAALLALDGDSLVSLAVPGSLLLTVADSEPVTLSASVKLDPDAPVRGVEDTLGARVDGSWILDRGNLAALVDARGGVVLDVGAEVRQGDVTIPAGQGQRLTGAQAAAYAVAVVEGESVEASAARFNQVLLGLLAVMPTDSGDVTKTISATERNPATTITSEDLTRVISGASQRIADDHATPSLVPTVPSASGEDSVTVESAGMEQLLAGSLAGAALPEAVVGPLRVSVQNGVGTAGLVVAARDQLVAAGFRYSGGGNAVDPDITKSTVLVSEDNPENRTRGAAVAAALGLEGDSLAVLQQGQSMGDVDIIVILGPDFAALNGSGQGS